MSVEAKDRRRAILQNAAINEHLTGRRALQPRPQWDVPHLVHVFPSFGLGGVQIRIATIINKLGDRYRHTVVALDGCFDTSSRLEEDINVAFERVDHSRLGLLSTLRQSRRLLRAVQPDLLLTYNWGAIEWALANRVRPLCRHIHFESGFGGEEADTQLKRRVLFRRMALARTDCLVMPSLTLVDIATNMWRIPNNKQHHIPNGVDWQKFAAAVEPATLPGFVRKPGELVIGTVAPLRAEKNVARLIRAFAGINDKFSVRLLVVGDGSERQRLEHLSRELSVYDRVHFAGMIESVESVLGHFDIFALSSDTEQMPNSILQAMAAALPIVATDVGDVAHITAPQNRPFIVEREQTPQLSVALDKLLEDGQLRALIGQANQMHVRSHYDLDTMVDSYEAIFSNLVSAS